MSRAAAELADGLIGFLGDLHLESYRVGVDEVIAAESLLLMLAAKGEFPADPRRLKTLIAPIICNSPREQDDFYSRFDAWVDKLLRNAPVRPEPPEFDGELAKIRGQWKLVRRWGVLVTITVLGALIGLAVSWLPSIGLATREDLKRAKEGPTVEPYRPQARTKSARPSVLAYSSLAALFLVPPVALVMLYQVWWHIKARRFLEKRPDARLPRVTSLFVKGHGDELYVALAMSRTSREFRRRQTFESSALDLTETLERTVRNAGQFTPVPGSHQFQPEYLVLVDRAGFRDHMARLVDELIGRLIADGVLVARYDFRGDPRTCTPREGKGPPVSLQELVARHPDDRLLIFSDGSGLFNPLSGEIGTWVDQLARWPQRALLTPVPATAWGYHEWVLEQNEFFVVPTDPEGLEALIDRIHAESGRYSSPDEVGAPYPQILDDLSHRWLRRPEPPGEDIEKCLEQLNDYLGDLGYYWLSACAVYPAIEWDLTLYLGRSLTSDGKPLLTEHRLVSLARLPWFRHGTMPDWLRVRLVRGLSLDRERAIRGALNQLLMGTLENPAEGFTLEVAKENRPILSTLTPPVVRRLLRLEPEDSPYRDYVFVRFLLGRKPRSPVVWLPRQLRLEFGRDDEGSPSTADLLWLSGRLGTVARGLITLAAILVNVLLIRSHFSFTYFRKLHVSDGLFWTLLSCFGIAAVPLGSGNFMFLTDCSGLCSHASA